MTQAEILSLFEARGLTTEQQVEAAIRAAMQVYKGRAWTRWAKRWLDGTDRSKEGAWAAWHAAAVSSAAAAESAAAAAESSAEWALVYASDAGVDVLAVIEEVAK